MMIKDPWLFYGKQFVSALWSNTKLHFFAIPTQCVARGCHLEQFLTILDFSLATQFEPVGREYGLDPSENNVVKLILWIGWLAVFAATFRTQAHRKANWMLQVQCDKCQVNKQLLKNLHIQWIKRCHIFLGSWPVNLPLKGLTVYDRREKVDGKWEYSECKYEDTTSSLSASLNIFCSGLKPTRTSDAPRWTCFLLFI